MFLGNIKSAFERNPDLKSLLLDDFFRRAVADCQDSWRSVVATAAHQGIPVPAFSTALSFYDAYRSQRLPANLIQVMIVSILPFLQIFNNERAMFFRLSAITLALTLSSFWINLELSTMLTGPATEVEHRLPLTKPKIDHIPKMNGLWNWTNISKSSNVIHWDQTWLLVSINLITSLLLEKQIIFFLNSKKVA